MIANSGALFTKLAELLHVAILKKVNAICIIELILVLFSYPGHGKLDSWIFRDKIKVVKESVYINLIKLYFDFGKNIPAQLSVRPRSFFSNIWR